MFDNNNIKLNTNEMISYIIIDMLRRKLREIETSQNKATKKDQLFVKKFTNYQEEEWKKLYENIIDKLKERHKIYIHREKKYALNDIKEIVTSTLKGNSSINKCNLHTQKYGEAVIIDDGLNVLIKDDKKKGSLPIKLYSNKRPEYIINGDKERLKLSRTLIATIQSIDALDNSFNDLNQLKEGFCEEYSADTSIDKQEVEKVFDEEIKYIERREKVVIDEQNNAYFSTMRGINSDKITHQPECADGIRYAELILSKKNGKETANGKTKKLEGVKQNDEA